ncbi:gliding motility-associated C-terminal domain-containing protein [Flavobacterium sp. A45]|uniref:T9SS type B sorting domain-containing protein n=1 Tax=Flavobacterium sp. A45 TaxID=1945862 RepID=UPI0013F65857|nr:gliding motility-associated C-terminal domain-containing protein [Flavobacterium sp. A45]
MNKYCKQLSSKNFKLKTVVAFFILINVNAQVNGSFPYEQAFTSGTKPTEITLLNPKVGSNSTVFTNEGVKLTSADDIYSFGAFYVNNRQFSSLNGLNIEFEYGMYGGTGADGISLFLFDAAVGVPTIGATGGGLGYSFNRANNNFPDRRQPGLTGAYLGIGFDGFRNFKNQGFNSYSRVNGLEGLATIGSTVTLRGGTGNEIDASKGLGYGFTGYPVLIGRQTYSGRVRGMGSVYNYELNVTGDLSFNNVPLNSIDSFTLSTATFSTDQNDTNYRKAFVSLIPNIKGGFNITVKVQHGLVTTTIIDNYWYRTSLNYKENANPLVTDFDNNNDIGPETLHTLLTPVPDLFKIGFAGSTGENTFNQLIRNLKVSLPYSSEANDDIFSYCANGNGSIFPLTNDVAYTNSLDGRPTSSSNNIDLTSFRFIDTSGNPQGQSFNVVNQGTWNYNIATGEVTFTPALNYKGSATIRYDVKGLTAPYNDDGYRNVPAVITANPYIVTTITSQPTGKVVNEGENTFFTVGESGGSGIRQYQWQVSKNNGSDWIDLSDDSTYSNTTSNTLSITNVPYTFSGKFYRVLITDSNSCGTVESNSAALVVELSIISDLSVTKSVNNSKPIVGTPVTFTITATNNGPDTATEVKVNDILPSGYTFVSATPSVGTWAAPIWTVGNLRNGANANLTIVATVNASGSYDNTAIISGRQADFKTSNNKSTASVAPTIIKAIADSNPTPLDGGKGGNTGINVYENDTLNGNLVDPSDVVLTSTPNGPLIINIDGTVTLAPNTPAGTYTADYTICEALNPANCSTTTVTIKVGCEFTVTCPTFASSKVQCYNDLPANSSLTISQFILLGNGDGSIIDSPCGAVEIIASNGPNNGCNASVIRTYTITEYADPNNNNTRDLGENIILNQFVCNQNILIEDTVPPTFVETVPVTNSVECSSIPKAQLLTATDNCSSATVNFSEIVSTVSSEGIYEIIRTWIASDACGNKTTATQKINVKIPDFIKKIKIEAVCNNDAEVSVNILDVIKNRFPEYSLVAGSFSDVNNSNALEISTGIFRPLNLANGDYIIRYENNDTNCPVIFEVTIPVITKLGCSDDKCVELIFHNTITPNGDGINDELVIDNVLNDCYKDNTIEIFNRWGVKVFESINYDNLSNGFKGYSAGRSNVKQSAALPSGTYFYIFKYKNLQGNSYSKTGWIYLNGSN